MDRNESGVTKSEIAMSLGDDSLSIALLTSKIGAMQFGKIAMLLKRIWEMSLFICNLFLFFYVVKPTDTKMSLQGENNEMTQWPCILSIGRPH